MFAVHESHQHQPLAHSDHVVMNRIDTRFAALRHAGRAGLIPFVTAGDPSAEATVPVLHALVDAGADALEIGVPFSDPMADGPVIQRASERAPRAVDGGGIPYPRCQHADRADGLSESAGDLRL
jgi:hypothetical protein